MAPLILDVKNRWIIYHVCFLRQSLSITRASWSIRSFSKHHKRLYSVIQEKNLKKNPSYFELKLTTIIDLMTIFFVNNAPIWQEGLWQSWIIDCPRLSSEWAITFKKGLGYKDICKETNLKTNRDEKKNKSSIRHEKFITLGTPIFWPLNEKKPRPGIWKLDGKAEQRLSIFESLVIV